MLRGKVEGGMALLSECSNIKESPEDKQASAPCVKGKCQDFTVCHTGTPHWCTMKKGMPTEKGGGKVLTL